MKINELKKQLSSQQNALIKLAVKTYARTIVGYLIAEKLAQKDKPLIDEELKESIVIAFNECCPEKVNLSHGNESDTSDSRYKN